MGGVRGYMPRSGVSLVAQGPETAPGHGGFRVLAPYAAKPFYWLAPRAMFNAAGPLSSLSGALFLCGRPAGAGEGELIR